MSQDKASYCEYPPMSSPIELEPQKRPTNHVGATTSMSTESDVPLWHGTSPSANKFSYDTDHRYPEDPVGRELGENARVWRYYRDEAEKFDDERIKKWNEIIDILLVFAGLFSGVLTAFLTQTSEYLTPDYQEVTARLLVEVLDRMNGGVPAAGTTSPIDIDSFKPRKIDLWINGLWFSSLSLSVSVAFFCVLCRQWLHHYTSGTRETLRTEVFIRQRRMSAMKKWKVSLLITLLPVQLSWSLLLFFVGLNVYLWDLNITVAIAILVFSFVGVSIVLCSYFLPIFFSDCPYVTTTSTLLYFAYRLLFPKKHGEDLEAGESQTTSILKSNPDSLFRHRELACVKATSPQLCSESLVWLYKENAANPAIASVVIEALAGIRTENSQSQVLRKDFIDVDIQTLRDNQMDKQAAKVLKQHAMSSSNLQDAKLILEGKGEDNVSKRLWKGCEALGGKVVDERIRKARERLVELENVEKTKTAMRAVWAMNALKQGTSDTKRSSAT